MFDSKKQSYIAGIIVSALMLIIQLIKPTSVVLNDTMPLLMIFVLIIIALVLAFCVISCVFFDKGILGSKAKMISIIYNIVLFLPFVLMLIRGLTTAIPTLANMGVDPDVLSNWGIIWSVNYFAYLFGLLLLPWLARTRLSYGENK